VDNQTELKLLFKEYVNNIFIRTYLAAQTFVRIIIAIWALRNNNISLDFLPSIFIYGALADFISSFFAIPIITLFQQIKYARFLGHFVFSFILVFGIVGQIIFWDEFNSNFNFIAVDYLIYTHEILGTLKESMPIYHVTAGIIFITFLLSIFTYKNPLHKPSMKLLIAGFILSITIGRIYDSNKIGPKENSFAHEISKNGPYEFFYAFFSNSLNYTQFYSVISSGNALKITRDKLQNSSVTYLNNKNLSRNIANPNKMSKKNVVIIMVESLNADFLQTFGNNDNITPELDKISKRKYAIYQYLCYWNKNRKRFRSSYTINPTIARLINNT
jgi:phosphoglycerol transferase MdoB-like AlkP superfamily enzyme